MGKTMKISAKLREVELRANLKKVTFKIENITAAEGNPKALNPFFHAQEQLKKK